MVFTKLRYGTCAAPRRQRVRRRMCILRADRLSLLETQYPATLIGFVSLHVHNSTKFWTVQPRAATTGSNSRHSFNSVSRAMDESALF